MNKYKQTFYDAGYAKGIIHGIGIAAAAGILIAGSVAIAQKIQRTRKTRAGKAALADSELEASLYNF